MTKLDLDLLEKLAQAATPGPWNFEPERWSAKCVIGIKPRDDRWLGHFQPEMNGEANGRFVVAANPQVVLALLSRSDKLAELLSECRAHHASMTAINEHMGYQFTQPLARFKSILDSLEDK